MIKSVPPLVGDTQRWYHTKFQAITHSIAQQHIAYCGSTKYPDAAIVHYHYHCNIYNKEKLLGNIPDANLQKSLHSMQILLAKISPLRKKNRFRICSHYPAAKIATSIVLATGN